MPTKDLAPAALTAGALLRWEVLQNFCQILDSRQNFVAGETCEHFPFIKLPQKVNKKINKKLTTNHEKPTKHKKKVTIDEYRPNNVIKLSCGNGMLLLRYARGGWHTAAVRGNAHEVMAMELQAFKLGAY